MSIAGSTATGSMPLGSFSGGSNQVRVRAYNERLVLSLVRMHGEMSKADITRASGLSAQTVSVIMRSLEKDGLLLRGEPIRGRGGQPSVPMRLNPDAVFSFGVKIGRRSADLVLMDFVGQIRMHHHETYAYPVPQKIIEIIGKGGTTTSVEQLVSADTQKQKEDLMAEFFANASMTPEAAQERFAEIIGSAD